MRITILTQYYPPETGAPQNRLHDLASRLVRFGHSVQVLTGMPHYPGTEVHREYVGLKSKIEWLDGVRVARVNPHIPKTRSFSNRLYSYLSFAGKAAWSGRHLLEPTEIILMESPPLFVAVAALRLKNFFKAKLVANISDPWPKAAVAMGIVKPGLALWMATKLEEKMYEESSLITGQSLGIIREIAARFPHKKVELFPNGVNTELYEIRGTRDAIRSTFDWRATDFIVGYTGLFGPSQALHQVLEAAHLLKDKTQIKFVFFGDGSEREKLQKMKAELNLSNIYFLGHAPAKKMPEIQSGFDAGIVPLANKPFYQGIRPSKIFEIMASGKPVIFCGEGETAEIVENQGAPTGIVVAPESANDLAAQIKWLAEHPLDATSMGNHGRRLAFEVYSREKIARKIENLLQEALGERINNSFSGSPIPEARNF